MKNILLQSLLLAFFQIPGFSINSYQPGDTLFVWAYHGLHLGASPAASGARLTTIPYGSSLVVLDSVRVKAFSTKEYHNQFQIKGYWSKVRFDTLEGWVFDGYLSRHPALRHFHRSNGRTPESEDYISYGKRVWGLRSVQQLDLKQDKPPTDTLSRRDIYHFKNGAVYEIYRGRGDGGWIRESFRFPDFSHEEAFLFFIYNTEFYHYDPKYHPNMEKLPDEIFAGFVRREGNKLEIRWSLCEYTFEKKDGVMMIKWFCSC